MSGGLMEGILTLLLFAVACGLSFGKGKGVKKAYLILSGALAALGVLGMLLTRPMLVSQLESMAAGEPPLDGSMTEWALGKFDTFTRLSVCVCVLTVLVLTVWLLLKRREPRSNFQIWYRAIVIAVMVGNLIYAVIYSLGTINKVVDLASTITSFAMFEVFALFIPLILKRLLVKPE